MDPHCTEFVRLLVSSGWTKAQAARELGVAPSVVTRYVKGVVKPSITIFRLMAGLIGDRVMLEGEGPTAMQWKEGPRYLDDWETDVINTLRRVEPASRRRAIAAIRDLVDAFAKPVRYTTPRTKEAPVRDPSETGFPHPGDEEAVMSALSEVVQVAREERAKEIEALRARLPKSSTSPRPSPDHLAPKPRRSS